MDLSDAAIWLLLLSAAFWKKKIVDREDITASTKSEESAAKIKEKLGIACSTDNRETAKHSDMVFLAVKPQFLEDVIAEIKDVLGSDQVIISIAAGKTMSWLEERIGGDRKIIRTMPNTPALVGEGITGVCRNALVEEKSWRRPWCCSAPSEGQR